MQPETFKNAIEIFTRQITTELLNVVITPSCGGGDGEVVCPKCKNSKVRFYPKVVKCANPDCGLVIFRNKSGKELSNSQITELLTKSKTSEIRGFKNNDGKPFDAALSFDMNYNTVFIFNKKEKK
jgi:DNA topoisomerase-3